MGILIQQQAGDIQQGFPTGHWLSAMAHLTQTSTGSIPGWTGYSIRLGLCSDLVLAVISLSHTCGEQHKPHILELLIAALPNRGALPDQEPRHSPLQKGAVRLLPPAGWWHPNPHCSEASCAPASSIPRARDMHSAPSSGLQTLLLLVLLLLETDFQAG